MVARMDLPVAPPSPIPVPREEQRFLLHNVRWEIYDLMRREFDTPAVRMSYDGSCLELWTSSFRHERLTALLGRFVERLAEERGLPLSSGGSKIGRAHV